MTYNEDSPSLPCEVSPSITALYLWERATSRDKKMFVIIRDSSKVIRRIIFVLSCIFHKFSVSTVKGGFWVGRPRFCYNYLLFVSVCFWNPGFRRLISSGRQAYIGFIGRSIYCRQVDLSTEAGVIGVGYA